MSTVPTTNYPPPGASPAGVPPATRRGPREIKLVSHSNLFYWWPIWALGFLMAAVTSIEGTRMVLVPSGTRVISAVENKQENKTIYTVDAPGKSTRALDAAADAAAKGSTAQPFHQHVSQKTWMGPLFCVVTLLTIVITNIPLRGLWSFLVILLFVILALIFSVADLWDNVLAALGGLHMYMNLSVYLFFAITVVVLWLVSVFVFDQRTYMIVTPGQIQVCEHIGAAVKNYPAESVTFEKQRDDLFRHWILGFFSGDLIIHVRDQKEEIRLPNVLWIGWRLEEVQHLLRSKETVAEGL